VNDFDGPFSAEDFTPRHEARYLCRMAEEPGRQVRVTPRVVGYTVEAYGPVTHASWWYLRLERAVRWANTVWALLDPGKGVL
jgi:hypothetical protein